MVIKLPQYKTGQSVDKATAHLLAKGRDEGDGARHNRADDEGVQAHSQVSRVQLKAIIAVKWVWLLLPWPPRWVRTINVFHCNQTLVLPTQPGQYRHALDCVVLQECNRHS